MRALPPPCPGLLGPGFCLPCQGFSQGLKVFLDPSLRYQFSETDRLAPRLFPVTHLRFLVGPPGPRVLDDSPFPNLRVASFCSQLSPGEQGRRQFTGGRGPRRPGQGCRDPEVWRRRQCRASSRLGLRCCGGAGTGSDPWGKLRS